MATDDNPFDEYNQIALSMMGDCIMAWSHVEVSTDTAIRSLLHMSGMANDAAEMIALNLDIREKCAIIASLAYLYRIDDDWLSNLLTIINTISNDLRNKRNRILHDTWSVEGTGQIHRKRRVAVRVGKPQSRQFELVIPSAEPADTLDMYEFTSAAFAAVKALNDLISLMLVNRKQERQREFEQRFPQAIKSQGGHLRRFFQILSRLRKSSQD